MPMNEYQPSCYFMQVGGKYKPGLYYQPPAKHQGSDTSQVPAPLWICDPFEVVARSRDSTSNNHGLLLAWTDRDRVPHEWVMPFELLAGDGVEIRKKLLAGGLMVSTKRYSKEHLLTYLQESNANIQATVRTVFTIGWQLGGMYVLPDEVIGE